MTLKFHDFNNFEKVGTLPWPLPENNKNIKTTAGDITLYQGNELSLYYDTNSWSLTRIAKTENINQKKLKKILGKRV
ncbi:cyclophilin-like fold protein [Lactobacillus acetotolerans]|uniref:cyclophilin-like fold protein n=1 Tax=Lactobacillus acetotolerans TaxID=1600 RepID=UPI0007B79644|nr:cyclophilin-like fold protein [Lactobacillus acetotolerans]QGV04701.1 hypothetical protein GJR85_04380 [Lactobacillus acetotolerans]